MEEKDMNNFEHSQVLSLAGLISYQVNSIVSRVILKSENGNVTLFAFAEGQELSEHTSPFDALVEVVEGQVEIRIAGQPFMLKDGDVIVMPAEVPHALKAAKHFKMLLTMIRP
jgi:quercetin dioxygenase-like cupin family protein